MSEKVFLIIFVVFSAGGWGTPFREKAYEMPGMEACLAAREKAFIETILTEEGSTGAIVVFCSPSKGVWVENKASE